tara:strand:- start:496 stop:1182 length:687 start_codon:yes stop_codon:yes gene_type:complete
MSDKLPINFRKHDIPEDYEWEVHNLQAYADLKAKVARGEKTLNDLKEFEHKYREKEDQREWRWRRENLIKELDISAAKKFREFKENPKAFMKKMADMGRGINMWWWKKPKKAAGQGKMIQNPVTGSWHSEYKPNKSMRLRAWLDAANQGKVMPHMNPKGKSLDRVPTQEELGKSEEFKKERRNRVWDWVLKETNNFGRGWSDPKWGRLYKGRPGRGGRPPRVGKYTIK